MRPSLRVRHLVGLPVLVVGGIGTPQDAEDILREQRADFVSLGRGLLADPAFAAKARAGAASTIRPCIRCNDGCIDRPRRTLRGIACSVNPDLGRDHLRAAERGERRRVAVAGAGPAGLHAALAAAARGHAVTLFEERELGGWLRTASRLEVKRDLENYLGYLERSLLASRVRLVRARHRGDPGCARARPSGARHR